MNERIKQLMDQAGIDVEAVENLGEMPTAMKFAELLIKEAIKTVQSVGDKASNDIPFEVTDLFVSQLRQRFGVQE